MFAVLLVFIPLVTALLGFVIKGKGARSLALASSVASFVVAVAAFAVFRNDPGSALLHVSKPWIAMFGIQFALSLDALGLLLSLLTGFLVPLIVLSSYRNTYSNPGAFYGLVLFMQMALFGVFMADDGFLFYIFWELALIPIYFICLLWGGENRGAITFKFFVYTLLGSLFMLIGLIYLYNQTGDDGAKSWSAARLYEAGRNLSASEQSIIFWLIFLAFAVKMPIFPFHTWQPDTYVNAPTQGTMLLSGIMLKMGTFGVIKWLLPVVPLGVERWATVAIVLSVIGIVYASCIAIAQKDFKRMIAYSSIAHVGLIAAGILTGNQQGIQGGIMQMLAHGVNVVGLFLIADILFIHTGTREMERLGGIRSMNGNFAVMFLIILLGAVALPLTNGFVGEFLLITGVYQHSATLAFFGGLTIILGAVYMFRSYQAIMLGEKKDAQGVFGALAASDKTVLIILCVAVIAFGVYPAPLNDIAETATKEILLKLK